MRQITVCSFKRILCEGLYEYPEWHPKFQFGLEKVLWKELKNKTRYTLKQGSNK
jgi:hypothetical protein